MKVSDRDVDRLMAPMEFRRIGVIVARVIDRFGMTVDEWAGYVRRSAGGDDE